MASKTTTVGPRQRILNAAFGLFYREGVNQTGIDRIIAEAKVAKASFYHHFESKDALIAAYAEERKRWWDAWFARQMAGGPTEPASRMVFAFDVLERFVRREEFCGCAFIGLAEQVTEPGHAARRVARESKEATRQFFTELAREALVPEPESVGLALGALVDGVLVSARMGSHKDTLKILQAARWAARRLIAAV